jgi:single-strand DNA-binding protein
MYNKVILIGNLTRDPEIRYTPQGTPVTNFSLALNRKYKAGEELREEVSYFDIVVFGKQAETSSQYLSKGSSVLIDGRLQQRRWEDKDTGQKRSKVEVVAENVRFMPKRAQTGEPTGAGGGRAGSGYESEAPPPEITDDEVPF